MPLNFNRYGNQAPSAPVDTLGKSFAEIKANFNQRVEYMINLQRLEWLFWVPFSLVVPAGAGADDTVDIKSDAHFECHLITGDFTTLNAGGADDGVNHMTIKISDASNDKRLMDSAAPLSLFLSPGRTLSSGVAGNPSNQLFYPMPFEHTFTANGGINCELFNSGATDNVVNLLFLGRKLRAEK